MSSNDFITQLTALTHPDTNAIRAAEANLKPMLKDPRCIEALMEVLDQQQQPAGVRQIAAILLRKRISTHYAKFDADIRARFKQSILTIISNEPERSVRQAIIGVIGVLNKADTAWPELFPFIGQASQNEHSPVREMSFLLMEELTDSVATQLEQSNDKSMASSLNSLLQHGLQDPDPKVNAATVKAAGGLLSYLAETDLYEEFQPVFMLMLQVADRLKHSNEDAVGIALDVLYDLILSFCPSIIQNLTDIFNWGLSLFNDEQMEHNIRDSAALVLATLCEVHSRKILAQPNLYQELCKSIYSIIAKSEESAAGALFQNNPMWSEDFEDSFDMNESSVTSMAQGTLDMMCLHLSPKAMYPVIMELSTSYYQTNLPNNIKSSLACMGVAAEGCCEDYTYNLQTLIPIVVGGLSHADVQVREVACFALGQFAEHCQPQVLSYASSILPALFPLLEDVQYLTVQVTSCYVLEQFCERLNPKDIRPVLHQLVEKLLTLLQSQQKRSIQEMSVAALSAVAVAAEEEFVPYLQHTANLLLQVIHISIVDLNDNNASGSNSLRGRALECFGHVAIAVGKQHIQPYFAEIMSSAATGLSSSDTDLHEFGYVLFANLAKVMEADFAPVLQELVPHLIQVLESQEGGFEWQQNPQSQQQFSSLDDSEDEGSNEDNMYLTVRTAALDAKRAAITALGEMARYVGPSFCPYVEPCLKALIGLLSKEGENAASAYLHDGAAIQSEAADALSGMVLPAMRAVSSSPQPMEILPPQVHAASTVAVKALVELMCATYHKEVCGKCCESLTNILNSLGVGVFVNNEGIQRQLMENLKVLLEGTGANIHGLVSPEDDPEGEEDDNTHESYLVSVFDLIGALAKVYALRENPSYISALHVWMPLICNYLKPGRSSNDRAMAIGLLGEMVEFNVDSVSSFLESIILPAAVSACSINLDEKEYNVQRNAAYLIGLMCEHTSVARTQNHYANMLQALSPLFTLRMNGSDENAEVDALVDNAAAAVCRMITANAALVPLPNVLPTLLNCLPLREDMTEHKTVFQCLLHSLPLTNDESYRNELKRICAAFVNDADLVKSSADDVELRALLEQVHAVLGQL